MSDVQGAFRHQGVETLICLVVLQSSLSIEFVVELGLQPETQKEPSEGLQLSFMFVWNADIQQRLHVGEFVAGD